MKLNLEKLNLFFDKFKELQGATLYNSWISQCDFYSTNIESELVVSAKTPFIIDWVMGKLKGTIEEAAQLAFGHEVELVKWASSMKAHRVILQQESTKICGVFRQQFSCYMAFEHQISTPGTTAQTSDEGYRRGCAFGFVT